MKKAKCVVIVVIVALVAPFLTLAVQAQGAAAGGDGWFANWSPDLVLEAKLGTERTIGTAELMFPLTQGSDSLWFLDLRARFDDDDSIEGNLGLGYRTTLNDCWVWGVYAYADYLSSTYDNTFWGGTLGSELMSENFIFRVNGYLPESGSKEVDLAFARIVGNSIVVVGENARERALPGGDCEVGYRFSSLIPRMENQDMWLYAGGFYFDAGGYDEVAGPRVRVEWNIDTDFAIRGSQLTVGGEWQYDDQRDSQGYLAVALRIPLGGSDQARGEKDWRRRALWRRVVRDVDIVSGISGLDESTSGINPLTGQPYGDVVYADGVGGGSGSLARPATLGNAIPAAGEDGVIVGLGGKGNLDAGGGTDLLDGQTLCGGGSILGVRTAGGKILPLRVPGRPGTIAGTGTGNDYLIGLANGNTVQNLSFVGSAYPARKGPEVAAIYGNGIVNAVLRDLTINGASPLDRAGEFFAKGIDIDNATGTVAVENVEISNTSKEAIRVKGDKDSGNTLDVTFTDVTTNAAGAVKAEELEGGSVAVDGLTVTDQSNGGEALKIKKADTVSLRNVDVTNGAAVKVEECGSVAVDGLTVTDQSDGGEAVKIKKAGTVSLRNVDVTNGAAVKVEECGDVSLEDVSVTDQSDGGEAVKVSKSDSVRANRITVVNGMSIKIEDIAGNVTVENSSNTNIADTKKSGFEFKKVQGTITLNNNRVVNNTGSTGKGFYFDDNTAAVLDGTGNTTTNVDTPYGFNKTPLPTGGVEIDGTVVPVAP
ncbi:MAG: inverse autotransporter beta domain-containing protein [Lentisphaeria bacterium]|jgi:hypothetical protein|nr:inverse autotransporter beta domain-containing protein [Lentisphaeria bacterium]